MFRMKLPRVTILVTNLFLHFGVSECFDERRPLLSFRLRAER